ncbi:MULTISPECIES: DNA repair protein RadC [Brevibacillus]|uniref:JAB domain-containing protein n=1 Tax=Brevibacillus invocatus TaxID=173959 RepID=A0A3M8C396_9BACL|nr:MULTISPECIES: DNA repair protein RadC [Brevibacillus]MCM3078052.1 DNA repair protein RadC [Brevibacillus invocatus]MCM3428362.1 DNA repair protein RadC [Brevibacillus invocatus]MDH4617525.1 DNA repair protein RadC [Brevibacillus sp. AY1]RNB70136.1 JAB domain-containing protein [Brevibacillus invocatus]
MSTNTCNKIVPKNVPYYDRPRERLLREGAIHLSDTELLAILLRTGREQESAYQLASRLLSTFGDLHGLAQAAHSELTELKGIGQVKAIELHAAFELGRRLRNAPRQARTTIRLPRDVADLMIPELAHLTQEHFVCLFLNTKNHVIGKQTIFVGSLDSSIVHPREVFKEAIRRSSASVICLHNHPSGDPTPSREDIAITRTLCEAGELVGISLLDHVIIGDGKYISLKEQGYM